MRLALICATSLLLTACANTEWVNVSNPRAEYVTDYNACQREAYDNPRFQAGSKMFLDESIDRCLKKQGWRLREKRN